MAGGHRTISGIGVGRGAAVGPVARAHPSLSLDGAPEATDPSAGAHLVEDAFAQVAAELDDRSRTVPPAVADVLRATAAMCRDPELARAATGRVLAGAAPAVAVDEAVGEFCRAFAAAGGLLAERVTDLRSIRDRVVARLLGRPCPGIPPLARPSVVVARDLAPADLAGLDPADVLGVVLEEGGPTSHTAVVAGQLGLPCVVRARGAEELTDGRIVALDAATGIVTVDPDEDATRRVTARRAALAALADDTADGATSDGHRVPLLANIGTAEDAERLRGAAVEGIGLFRTEVLFLDAPAAPSPDEQAAVYARVLSAAGGRKAVIRTLDAGADKPLPFVARPGEENPALGVRGYRLARVAPDVLETQLAAIARAGAATGTAPWVMAPMVATAAEARAFATAARAAGLATVGVMVEVPAAALCARDLLREVDFVSLGTNDLAQYTMAADRLRGELADLLDPWQPAVLRLVAATAGAGVELGKPVAVCGESAADPAMALVLVGLGVSSLSMSPGAVPEVRHCLSRHTLDQCQAMARAALRATSARRARAAAVAMVDPAVRELLAVAPPAGPAGMSA